MPALRSVLTKSSVVDFIFEIPTSRGFGGFAKTVPACLPLPQTLQAHATVCSFCLLSPPKPSQDGVAGVPSVSLGTWHNQAHLSHFLNLSVEEGTQLWDKSLSLAGHRLR